MVGLTGCSADNPLAPVGTSVAAVAFQEVGGVSVDAAPAVVDLAAVDPGFRPSVGLLQRSYAVLTLVADPCRDRPSVDHPLDSSAASVGVRVGSAG